MAQDMTMHERAYRGEQALAQIASPLIVICGAGTLGSPLADTLARQGVKRLRVIDFDRVEAHNIGTQLYGRQDVGARKVDALRNRLFREVGIQIEAVNLIVDNTTVRKALNLADMVVDCFDNTAARQSVFDYCRDQHIPCLHLGLNADFGVVHWQEDYQVPDDRRAAPQENACEYPLARNLATIIVALGSEAILDHLLHGEHYNHTFTLRDRKITTWESHPD